MFEQELKVKKTELFPILSGEQLLAEPYCRQTWNALRKIIPLTDADFEQYYTATFKIFAEYVQTLPATRYSLYAKAYGCLHLALDRAMIAVKLALKTYQETAALTPEQLSAEHQAELFAVFAAAVTSDLGILPQRFKITVRDRSDQLIPFDIYAGSFVNQGKEFDFEFIEPELPDWPAPASLILARNILANTHSNYKLSAFAWLSQSHKVLQLWFNLMLRLTPREDEMTRRTLCTLIPRSDAELMDKFLEQQILERKGAMGAGRLHSPLFIPLAEEEEETPDSTAQQEIENYLRRGGTLSDRERVLGETPGPSDASNTRFLGSHGTSLAPKLTQGFAFLRWLRTSLQNGQLMLTDEQASLAFRTNEGLVLALPSILAAYAKQKGVKIKQTDLLRDLQQIGVSSPGSLALKNYVLKTTKGQKTFQGILLDNPYMVYSNTKLPPLTLGLAAESIVKSAAKVAAKATASLFEPKLTPE